MQAADELRDLKSEMARSRKLVLKMASRLKEASADLQKVFQLAQKNKEAALTVEVKATALVAASVSASVATLAQAFAIWAP